MRRLRLSKQCPCVCVMSERGESFLFGPEYNIYIYRISAYYFTTVRQTGLSPQPVDERSLRSRTHEDFQPRVVGHTIALAFHAEKSAPKSVSDGVFLIDDDGFICFKR